MNKKPVVEKPSTSKVSKPSTVTSDIKTVHSNSQGIPSESNQRVIKKIVSLDATKLRGLGIESTILSAITKLNKSDTKTPAKASTSVHKQTPPTVNKPIEVQTTNNVISQESAPIASTSTAECSPSKKVHVLSSVVLNENKWMDLEKISTAISTTVKKKSDALIEPCVAEKLTDEAQIASAEAKTINAVDPIGKNASEELQKDSFSEVDSNSVIDTKPSQPRENLSKFSVQREENSPQEQIQSTTKIATTSKKTTSSEQTVKKMKKGVDTPSTDATLKSTKTKAKDQNKSVELESCDVGSEVTIEDNQSTAEQLDNSNISVEQNEPLLTELKTNVRKRKQTFVSDYFANKNKEYSFEITANTSTHSPTENALSAGEQSSTGESKSSRYGRAIKPKRFEMESINMQKSPIIVKNEPELSLNDSNMEVTMGDQAPAEQESSNLIIMPPPKKRGRPKRSQVFADENSAGESSANFQQEERETYILPDAVPEPEPEPIITKRRIRMPSKLIAYEIEENRKKERRKQKAVQETVNQTLPVKESSDVPMNNSLVGISKSGFIEPTPPGIVKRRGRPKKNEASEQIQQFGPIEMQDFITDADDVINTPTFEEKIADETPKRRGRPKKIVIDQPAVSEQTEQFEPIEMKDSVNIIETDDVINTSAFEEIEAEVASPKRRGRRSKKTVKYKEIEETDLFESTDVSMDETILDAKQTKVPTAKPTVRPKKMVEVEKDENCEANDLTGAVTSTSDNTPKRHRGRPRLNPDENIVLEKDNSYECGNCKQLVLRTRWKPHALTHYGATWRESVDEPIDLDDQGLVARIMTKFIKYNKVQYLRCAKCYDAKRSVVGYLSHIELCGLSPEEVTALKAECEFCKKLYRKVSLPTHQQSFCPVRRKQIEAEKQNEPQPPPDPAANTEADAANNEERPSRPKRNVKKPKRRIYTRSIDDYIKIGVKVTGGVYKAWLSQLAEEKRIKCSYLNCTFATCDLEEMRSHFSECRGKMVQCKLCLYATQSREDVYQHIEQKHADVFNADETDEEDPYHSDGDSYKADSQSSSDDDYDENEDEQIDENGEKRPKRHSKRHRSRHKNRKRTVPLSRILSEDTPAYWDMIEEYYNELQEKRATYFELAYKWTNDFVSSHYDQKSLVIDRHVQNTIKLVCLKKSEANAYIKSLLPKSTEFVCQKQQDYHSHPKKVNGIADWITLELFKSINITHTNRESSTLFCGGGIVALEWIPFPSDYTGCQILAICSRNSSINYINAANKPSITAKSKHLVQLWGVTTKSQTAVDKAEFLYGIAYEDGPIYTFAFCPSDAYNADQRLALLALPDCYGNINIISLPEKVSKTKDNAPSLIKLEPIIKLQTTFSDKKAFQTITKIAWLRTKGHSTLCAGYNTGLVAIWNFEHLSSAYLCKRTAPNNVALLLPKRTFMGSLNCIMQLDLHADLDNQPRWLLVGGLDRKTRLYDLNDNNLSAFVSPMWRSRILTGAWPLHWPIYFSIIDAAITRLGGGFHIKQILNTNNFGQSTNLLNEGYPSNLSFSDWLNAGVYGTDTGDVYLLRFQQLMVHDRYDNSNYLHVLCSANMMIEDDEPNNEENSKRRKNAKLIFLDSDTSIRAPKLATRVTPIHQYPYAKVNQAAINPNNSHHKMYAIGYEAGFCRIQFLP